MRCLACFSTLLTEGQFYCAINPKTSRELEVKCEQPVKEKKTVLVAGGGIGGMQAALTCAERGHNVILCEKSGRLGGTLRFGAAVPSPVWRAASDGGVVIDCRGLAAREDLPTLRGVRGEMAVLRSREVQIKRPVRLLHPRFGLYVVPWSDDRYMVGATVIERDDAGPVTVRSALDLLGTAYALHPGFGEAEILELSAGVRPAFPDNVPHIVAKGRRLLVNGAFRHGYLLAPVMAEIAATYLETGALHPILNVE